MMKKKIKFFSFIGILVLLLITLVGCFGEAVSVVDAEINNKNELVFELSDGKTINVGVVIGGDGQPGSQGPIGLKGTDGISVV